MINHNESSLLVFVYLCRLRRVWLGKKKVKHMAKAITVSCFLVGLSVLFFAPILLLQPFNTETAVAPVTGLSQPFGISITPNGEYAYVTNGGSASVSVINTATNTVSSTIPVGISPFGVAITPDGEYVYVTNGGSASVSVIETATNTITATIIVGIGPYGVAITPNGEYAYITNFGTSTVSVVSTASNMVVATIPVGNSPQGIAITPDGKYVYVANFGGGTVSVVSTNSNTVAATLTVECGPVDIAFTSKGSYAYVVNSGSGSVSVIEVATTNVVSRIAGFTQPSGIALTSNDAYVYATNLGGDTVSVISTANNSLITSITVGMGPYGVAITPNDERAYVVNYNSATVSVVDVLPAVNVSPTFCSMDTGQSKTFTAIPSGGSGDYGCFQWYVNGTAQPGAVASTFDFSPTSNGLHLISVAITDSLGVISAESKASIVSVPWVMETQVPISNTPITNTVTPADHFFIPAYCSYVKFAVNGTYSNATFEDNTWTFTDLRLKGSQLLSRFQISIQGSNITIVSFNVTQNSTFQILLLKYIVDDQSKQVVNLGIGSGRFDSNDMWSVVNNNVSLAEGKDWNISRDGTIILKSVRGEVSIKQHTFGDFFGNGEVYANLSFHEQHSVGITFAIALVITVAIAVVVKIKTRDSSGEEAKR